MKRRINFAITGIDHPHIFKQINYLIIEGNKPVCFHTESTLLAKYFKRVYPEIPQVNNITEILEDETIDLVLNAGIPSTRSQVGIKVMLHGKDYLVDKPGMINLEQFNEVCRVQEKTKRLYAICYGERYWSKSSMKAGNVVKSGMIGDVIQVMCLGPHNINSSKRPTWFFQKQHAGGILTDLGSHGFDQFLYFSGSKSGEVVFSRVANVNNTDKHDFEDFGEAVISSDSCSGYVRVDWLTPDALGVSGDSRVFILGTEGYVEIRKKLDIAGRTGDEHLFVVNKSGTKYINCQNEEIHFAKKLTTDILDRTETLNPQYLTFLAMELALKAENNAKT